MEKGDTIDVKINHIYYYEHPSLSYWHMVVRDKDDNEYIYEIPTSVHRNIRNKIENENLEKYEDGKFRAVIKQKYNNKCYLIKWPNIWPKK